MQKKIRLSDNGADSFRKRYHTLHSKFIHSSWLTLQDLDREVTLNEKQYTVHGVWETAGSRVIILLKPVGGGFYLLTESQQVANAMGYTRMRNQVTGEEHDWDIFPQKSANLIELPTEPVSNDEDEETDGKDENADGDAEEDEEIDPIVKALQDATIDEGDIHAY